MHYVLRIDQVFSFGGRRGKKRSKLRYVHSRASAPRNLFYSKFNGFVQWLVLLFEHTFAFFFKLSFYLGGEGITSLATIFSLAW